MQLKIILLGAFAATTALAGLPTRLFNRPHGDNGVEHPAPVRGLVSLAGMVITTPATRLLSLPDNHILPGSGSAPTETNSYAAERLRKLASLDDMLASGVGPTGATLEDKAKASILRQIDHLEHLQLPDKRQLGPGFTAAPATANAIQGQIEKLENILEIGVGPTGVTVDEDIRAAVLNEIDHLQKQIVSIGWDEQGLSSVGEVVDKRQMRHLPFPVNTEKAMEELGLEHEEKETR